MSLLRVESFDHWVTADGPKKGWTLTGASVVVSAGNGRNSTASLRTTNQVQVAQLSVSNSGRSGIVGFAFRTSVLPPSVDTTIFVVKEGATEHLRLVLLTTGALRLVRVPSTTLATSASTPITAATMHYIEFAWNLHDTTGSYEVKVNGASTIPATSSADTQNSGTGIWNGLMWWGVNTGAQTHDIDDVYVADDNTFRGDHRIVSVVASSGNGSNTAWTPSTGTDHGALVDEASPNPSDYVSTSSAGAIDTFNFAALGVAGTVAAVQVCHYAKADVAGVRQLANVAWIGGAPYPSAAVTLPADWEYKLFLSTTSPATATAWTPSEIDAAEFGPKVAV